ncbi:hypothetical protein CSOJ01_14430, partial [Colletotrichum sojae]
MGYIYVAETATTSLRAKTTVIAIMGIQAMATIYVYIAPIMLNSPTLEMSNTDLPCELVASVLGSLDDLRSLSSVLLASRHIYASFKAVPGIEASIIRRQVTPGLVPYAIAVLEASHLPRERHLITGVVSADRKAIIRLLDELNDRPTELLARLSSMPRSDLRKISDMHRLIHTLSMDFANNAWSHICGGNSAEAVTAVVLSAEEYRRYCRSFYRAELFYSLFRFAGGNADIV